MMSLNFTTKNWVNLKSNKIAGFKTTVFCIFLFSIISTISSKAQDCNSLYLITGSNGAVNSINVSTAAKTLVAIMTTGRENLAVGPDPTSTGTTVFTSSQQASGSTVFKANTSISTTLPATIGGFAANPATTGATAGFVYGLSSAKHLIKASPAPAANKSIITGYLVWNAVTKSGNGFFNNKNELCTFIQNGSSS